jgi:hypothetical protein
MEQWKDIPGFDGYYQASPLGNIRSLDRHTYQGERIGYVLRKGKVLRAAIWGGYYGVVLRVDSKSWTVPVHRLVAMTFHPAVEGKNEVNHKNGIKTDNRAENLEWVTRRENIIHALETGLLKGNCGSKNGNSKLVEDNIEEIKRLRNTGLTQDAIAGRFGVSQTTIGRILSKNTWAGVKVA